MEEKVADTTIAQQVELVTRRLESLSTLPSIVAQFFSKLLQPKSSVLDLADIIESDPALTVRIFSLISQQEAGLSEQTTSIRQGLERLPEQLVRDAVLSVKVFGTFEADHGPDSYRALPRKHFALHNLAVACCARDVAEIISPQADAQMAYSAGLLHDIGKLALDQEMPKSFARIIREAKLRSSGACAVEQKRLGTDHTILGKRLAQKWHLPGEITLAIWLHHTDTTTISQGMPEAKIAQIVQLADLIARQCNIGQSGSYDVPDFPEAIAQSLKIGAEQLQQIRRNLTGKVAQKSKVLGLDLPDIATAYCEAVHTMIARLARNNTKLSLENSQLQTASSHFDFTKDFLLSVNSTTSAIEVAESFATRWQKFYQTGMVCLYLMPPSGSGVLEAVVVEGPSRSKVVLLNEPTDSPAIPQAIANSFEIINADGHIDWLFEQLDVDFESSQTKLVPLLSGGKAVGVIVFEFRYPTKSEQLEEKFKAVASTVGAVLDMAFAWEKQQHFAEQFAGFLAKLKAAGLQMSSVRSLNALAEMAAGAAHELNNPLSVISGRAQLLSESETDPEKKQILEQINANSSEISQIIEDLMSFAEPRQPKPAQINIEQVLDEATQLAAQKTKVEKPDVQIDIADGPVSIFVDSAQIASAIANVFSNSIESYAGQAGPIKVAAAVDESGELLTLQIIDRGCGMDAEAVQKATQPFFSAKPAGRKRGMGLAHAQRIIQLNNGSLNITSQPGSGTTVTISLPCVR